MYISKKDKKEVYRYLFQEGVLYAEKNLKLEKHPQIAVSNLIVLVLMRTFKSKEYVKEQFAWRHYYWFLTSKGVEYLREYLNLPEDIVPATHKSRARPATDRPPRPGAGRGRPDDKGPRDSDYKGGCRGGPSSRDDKGVAPGTYEPQYERSFGRGRGFQSDSHNE